MATIKRMLLDHAHTLAECLVLVFASAALLSSTTPPMAWFSVRRGTTEAPWKDLHRVYRFRCRQNSFELCTLSPFRLKYGLVYPDIWTPLYAPSHIYVFLSILFLCIVLDCLSNYF